MRHHADVLAVVFLGVATPATALAQNGGYTPGVGFWVGDARGVALLRTALQPRYECESTLQGDDPCSANGFLLRRARVRLGAVIAEPSAELALQADLADPDQPLEEAYALVRPWAAVRVAAGLLRVPLLREGLYAEELVPLGELSPLTERVQPGRDIGLLLGVRVGRLDATIGAWNGAPRAFENDNIDLLYAARMTIDLVGTSPVPAYAGDPSLVARAVPGAAERAEKLHVSLGCRRSSRTSRSGTRPAASPSRVRYASRTAARSKSPRTSSASSTGRRR
jgi:hypothetical protein